VVLPADAEKFPLYKSIVSKVSLPVAYRTRQCDAITVPEATVFSWRLGVKNAPENPTFLANMNSCSLSLYAVARPYVRRLFVVCNARAPYSGSCNFRNLSTAFGTLAIR